MTATLSYYTLGEAADRMRVSPETLKRAIYAGDLRAKKTGKNGGGNYVVSSADLDAWYESLVDA